MSRKIKKAKKPAKVVWLARDEGDDNDYVNVFTRKPRKDIEDEFDWATGKNIDRIVFNGRALFGMCAAGLQCATGISLKPGECIAVRVVRARG